MIECWNVEKNKNTRETQLPFHGEFFNMVFDSCFIKVMLWEDDHSYWHFDRERIIKFPPILPAVFCDVGRISLFALTPVNVTHFSE